MGLVLTYATQAAPEMSRSTVALRDESDVVGMFVNGPSSSSTAPCLKRDLPKVDLCGFMMMGARELRPRLYQNARLTWYVEQR
jgi:hypothetical protein